MAHIVCPLVSAEDRAGLEAVVADRNCAQKHVARARIILGSAHRLSVAEIARRAGVGRPACGAGSGASPRPGSTACCGTRPASPARHPWARMWSGVCGADLRRTAGRGDRTDRPGDGRGSSDTRSARCSGSGPSMTCSRTASALSSARTTPRSPRNSRTSAASYIDPPKHAVVLSVDEKSQIQALDRTQPGLPLKPGKAGTMTHDYLRNGITTLFAALNVLDGTVLGRCMQRHRHLKFLRFLNAIGRAVPAGKVIHVILDNYGNHKHPKVLRWLARHPRFIFHFTPTARLRLERRRDLLLGADPASPQSVAASIRWSTCRRRSTATSTNTTMIPSRSPGPRHRRRSSLS